METTMLIMGLMLAAGLITFVIEKANEIDAKDLWNDSEEEA